MLLVLSSLSEIDRNIYTLQEIMETLISSRSSDLQSVPANSVLPPRSRVGQLVLVPTWESIPVIDLAGGPVSAGGRVMEQIMKASEEHGFFQLINHGVPETLIQDVLQVSKEFMELPTEDREKFFTDDPKQSTRLSSSVGYGEKVHYWRDYFRHPCHPLEEHVQSWPETPARYREVMGSFSKEAWNLSLWLLDLICEGLGLEKGYLAELSKVQMLCINQYPKCPDPSLTLGLPKHCDIHLITLLIQGDVNGLQILKDGQWLAIEPLPNAFVVNIGQTLKIISNGKLTSAEHRAVTNKDSARTTVVSCIHPSGDTKVEPAKTLINESSPSLCRPFLYKSLFSTYMGDIEDDIPPLDRYK